MKRAYIISVLLSISVLAGCGTTKQEFAVVQETIKGSAKGRKLAMTECMAKWSPIARKNAAIVIDSSEKDAPRMVCSRTVEAIRSGRLNYDDVVSIKRGKFTPKLVKIFQGRS